MNLLELVGRVMGGPLVGSFCAITPLAAPAYANSFPSMTTAQAEAPPQAITLEAALNSAEHENIDVLVARLAVQTANANLRSADTAPNPVLSANALQVRPPLIGKLPYGDLVDTIVRVDLPLERGGKRRARTNAARALIEAAKRDV